MKEEAAFDSWSGSASSLPCEDRKASDMLGQESLKLYDSMGIIRTLVDYEASISEEDAMWDGLGPPTPSASDPLHTVALTAARRCPTSSVLGLGKALAVGAILNRCSLKDRCMASRVCRSWWSLLADSPQLWEHLDLRAWPRLSPRGLRGMMWRSAGRLKSIRLPKNMRMSHDTVLLLAANCGQLRALDVSASLRGRQLPWLLRRCQGSLSHLYLRGNHGGMSIISEMLESSIFPKLTGLQACGSFAASQWTRICRGLRPRALTTLHVGAIPLDSLIQLLADNQHSLTSLTVEYVHTPDTGPKRDLLWELSKCKCLVSLSIQEGVKCVERQPPSPRNRISGRISPLAIRSLLQTEVDESPIAYADPDLCLFPSLTSLSMRTSELEYAHAYIRICSQAPRLKHLNAHIRWPTKEPDEPTEHSAQSLCGITGADPLDPVLTGEAAAVAALEDLLLVAPCGDLSAGGRLEGPPGWRAIAGSLPGLVSIDTSERWSDSELLVIGSRCTRMSRLVLCGSCITAKALSSLAKMPLLTSLQLRLCPPDTPECQQKEVSIPDVIGIRSLSAIRASYRRTRSFSHQPRLNMYRMHLSGPGVIVQPTFFADLVSLRHCRLEGKAALKDLPVLSTYCPLLVSADIGSQTPVYSPITPRLGAMKPMQYLSRLCLRGQGAISKQLELVLPSLPVLRHLLLDSCAVTGEVFGVIGTSCLSLRTLVIRDCPQIGQRTHLRPLQFMDCLKSIRLEWTNEQTSMILQNLSMELQGCMLLPHVSITAEPYEPS